MFPDLREVLAPGRWWGPLQARLTLTLNHVLAAEPAALARLRPHAGRSILCLAEGEPLPGLALPPTRWRITPLGALDAEDADPAAPADLRLTLKLLPLPRALPAMLAGQRPPVAIEGDAQLAADAAWLIDNLRWDLESDLARVLGPAPAHAVAEAGRALAAGLRGLAGRVQSAWPAASTTPAGR